MTIKPKQTPRLSPNTLSARMLLNGATAAADIDTAALAEGLATHLSAGSTRLAVIFNDAQTGPHLQMDGQRLGAAFNAYSQWCYFTPGTAVRVLLQDVVGPLQNQAPDLFAKGLTFLEEKAPLLGPEKETFLKFLSTYKLRL